MLDRGPQGRPGPGILGYPDQDGRPASEAATIPQVWDFLEQVEALNREELDRWVMAHLPAPAPAHESVKSRNE